MSNDIWVMPPRSAGSSDAYLKFEPGTTFFRIYPWECLATEGDVKLGRAVPQQVGSKVVLPYFTKRTHWDNRRPSHVCPVVVTLAGTKLGRCAQCDEAQLAWSAYRDAKSRGNKTETEQYKTTAMALGASDSYLFNAWTGTDWKIFEANYNFLSNIEVWREDAELAGAQFFGPQGIGYKASVTVSQKGKKTVTFSTVATNSPVYPKTPEQLNPYDPWKNMRYLPDWAHAHFKDVAFAEASTVKPPQQPQVQAKAPEVHQPSLPVQAAPAPSQPVRKPGAICSVIFGPGDHRAGQLQEVGADGLYAVSIIVDGAATVFNCTPDEVIFA